VGGVDPGTPTEGLGVGLTFGTDGVPGYGGFSLGTVLGTELGFGFKFGYVFSIVPYGFCCNEGVSLGTMPGVGVMPGVANGLLGFSDGEIFGFAGTVTPGTVLDGDGRFESGTTGVGEMPGVAVEV
jgi:hypothetical protein